MARLFEKISKDQWMKDMADGTVLTSEQYTAYEAIYESIVKPYRGSSESAGYDFFAPEAFTLKPGETIKIATGIKAQMNSGEYLDLRPRSGQGFKYRIQLDNTTGIIDADYYNNSGNEGHIFIKITNDSIVPSDLSGDNLNAFISKKTLSVPAGEGFAQGIFLNFLTTDDDAATVTRTGGLGSTSASA